jgi:hypothetical protein
VKRNEQKEQANKTKKNINGRRTETKSKQQQAQ